jgi:N-acetylmuramoyl-L-alanine amidase
VRCCKRSRRTSRPLSFDPLQHGVTGPRVRELHDRLIELGHAPLIDPLGTYADGTVVVVEAFQRSRGLPITGVVDATTWSRLIEAGWQLGQRLLYLARPNVRGDDVAELQVRLAQLGFNPGRIDGIFGPVLERALSDFQRNCGLAGDGTLTQATLRELTRMTLRTPDRHLVNDARDLAGFDEVAGGPLVLCGNSPLAPLLEQRIGTAYTVYDLSSQTDDQVAHYANEHAAAAVLKMQVLEHLNGIHLHYWASYRAHSRRGEQLASALAIALTRSQLLPPIEVTGMALPIMRETAMTTLHVEHGSLGETALFEFCGVTAQILGEVFHR